MVQQKKKTFRFRIQNIEEFYQKNNFKNVA
jgi:hypothetical protein